MSKFFLLSDAKEFFLLTKQTFTDCAQE